MIAFAQALVATLAAALTTPASSCPVAPTWRIEENRWAALRDGLGATLADLDSGEPVPARERLAALIDEVAPAAARLGATAELDQAHASCWRPAAAPPPSARAAGRDGIPALPAWLAERFLG